VFELERASEEISEQNEFYNFSFTALDGDILEALLEKAR